MRQKYYRHGRRWIAAFLVWGCCALPGGSGLAEEAAPAAPSVTVVGTEFRVTLPDGRVLAQEELVGAVLTVADGRGGRMTIRIDSAERDPRDPEGEIMLYGLSIRDPASGHWGNLCAPDPEGRQAGFPLAGTWTGDGRHLPSATEFSLTCTSGVEGKCVRFGYRPWRTLPDGTSLWEHHQACTRLLRADYCGDGRPHTRDGTLVNIYDRIGIQHSESAIGMTFEAAWGPEGAVCVSRVRRPELFSLEALAASCPRLPPERIGARCEDSDGAILFNWSF